jgi:hypothetical protein
LYYSIVLLATLSRRPARSTNPSPLATSIRPASPYASLRQICQPSGAISHQISLVGGWSGRPCELRSPDDPTTEHRIIIKKLACSAESCLTWRESVVEYASSRGSHSASLPLYPYPRLPNTDRNGQFLSVSCNPVLAVEQVIARCIG